MQAAHERGRESERRTFAPNLAGSSPPDSLLVDGAMRPPDGRPTRPHFRGGRSMKRILGQFFTVAAVATLFQALVPACAANDESIYIRLVEAPPTSRQNGGCVYQPDATQTFLIEGTLDVSI